MLRVNETDTLTENICHTFKLRNLCFLFLSIEFVCIFQVCKTLRYFIKNLLAILSK